MRAYIFYGTYYLRFTEYDFKPTKTVRIFFFMTQARLNEFRRTRGAGFGSPNNTWKIIKSNILFLSTYQFDLRKTKVWKVGFIWDSVGRYEGVTRTRLISNQFSLL